MAAALEWATQRRRNVSEGVLVVGIRSIGTSLSASVAVCLQAAGWETRRITVRPYGHPFHRKARLPFRQIREGKILVIDEGPGISGSSFAAVIRALIRAGASPDGLSILPGHGNGPGRSASPKILDCWNSIPQRFVPLEKLRWNRRSLQSRLSQKAGQFCGFPEKCGDLKDLNAGKWRELHFQAESEWPAVAFPFERAKYLCRTDGKSPVLWKFVGLGPSPDQNTTLAEAALWQMKLRAERGWAPYPLGTWEGFLAMPWVEGNALQSNHAADPFVLKSIGCYLIDSAAPPLTGPEQKSSRERLRHMLLWNLKNLLGEKVSGRVTSWIDALPNHCKGPASGDGKLSPCHWIQTSDGRLFKFSGGHPIDHTWIGKQPWTWDLAGTLIEWNLSDNQSRHLLSMARKNGFPVNPDPLIFFSLAYAAFHAGMMSFGVANSSPEDPERSRLIRAQAFYVRILRQILQESDIYRFT